MKKTTFFSFLAVSIAVFGGCAPDDSPLFGVDRPSSSSTTGPSGGGDSSTGGNVSGTGGSDGGGMSASVSVSSSVASSSSASSTSSSSGSGGPCIPQECPAQTCGTFADGCGGVTVCQPCGFGDNCGGDHHCQTCVPSKTPEQVCAGKCGYYVDECGVTQDCGTGTGSCPAYQYCPSSPQNPPFWDSVPSCYGCERTYNFPICGSGLFEYTCPVMDRDGLQNGSETGVDCGGNSPEKCSAGSSCKTNADCKSQACQGGVCLNSSFPQSDCTYLINAGIWCCPKDV